jgi:hypothetical protein
MERILLVFKNAFRGILFARSMYLWIIAILIVGLQLAPQIIFRDAAPNIAAFGQRQRQAPSRHDRGATKAISGNAGTAA